MLNISRLNVTPTTSKIKLGHVTIRKMLKSAWLVGKGWICKFFIVSLQYYGI